MAVNRYRLKHKARIGKRYAKRLLHMLKRPDRVLAAILIGSTFANMLASSVATLIALHFWGERGALIAAMALTLIVMIFAEIAPKTLAAVYPEKVVGWVALPIQIVLKILYPVVWLANTVTNSLLRLLRVDVSKYAVEPLTREELRSVVYDTTGKISRHYQNMLFGILDLNKLCVDDVMVPRHEITGIDIEQPLEKILTIIRSLQDWVPVYREEMNQVIGVLYLRDVLKLSLSHAGISKETLQQSMHEPYFVPEGTQLSVQMSHFQQSKEKIAFVVDEYGEVQGMLTLNDILEEIVGDFTTNLSAAKRIQPQPDGSYLVEGSIATREFNRVTECELPLHGPRTINGLIVEHLQTLPQTGVAVLIAGYPIEIMQVQNKRVQQARIFPRLGTKEQ